MIEQAKAHSSKVIALINADDTSRSRSSRAPPPASPAMDQTPSRRRGLRERGCWRPATITSTSAAARTRRSTRERQGQRPLLQRRDRRDGHIPSGLYSRESSIIAPGLDPHGAVYRARDPEYCFEDPMLTALMSTPSKPKHFAFDHQGSKRSGLSTFMTEQAARENEPRGFRMTMSSDSRMTAFNRADVSYVRCRPTSPGASGAAPVGTSPTRSTARTT